VARARGDELLAAFEQRGLTIPLRVLLDAHRPIAPLLSDAAAALAPMLTTLGVRGLAHLLADPARTVEQIDAMSETSRGGARLGADTCRTQES
jgi:hypothetical protein